MRFDYFNKKYGRPRQNSIIAGDPPRPASTNP